MLTGIGKGRTIFFFLDHHQITGHEKVEKTDPYFHKGKLLWLADSLCSLVFGGAFSNISSLLSNYTRRCTSVDAVITLSALFWRAFRSKLVSDAPKVPSLVPLSQGGNAGHLLVHGRAMQFGLSRLRHFPVKVSSETVLALVQHQQLSVQSPHMCSTLILFPGPTVIGASKTIVILLCCFSFLSGTAACGFYVHTWGQSSTRVLWGGCSSLISRRLRCL